MSDTSECVTSANFVIDSFWSRFGLLRLLLLLDLLRCGIRGGYAVTGNVHSVEFEREVLKIDQAVRVDIYTEVANFEVEVGTVGTSGIAAQTDNVAGFDYLSGIDKTSGKVSIVGFQTVVVADNHKVAVTTGVAAFGDADHTVPSGCHGGADWITEVNATVHTSVSPTIIRGLLEIGRMVISS